jgi:septum formation protein
MRHPQKKLVLASTSPYRKTVLSRLNLPFDTFAPNVDETPLPDELPALLVQRLSEAKARSAQAIYPNALIIGSDQVAVLDKQVLNKPLTHDKAIQQLQASSGKQVDFLTGLCLLNTKTGHAQVDIVRFSVLFRQLTISQIENYLRLDQPYHCAGSFKSESLGIVLLDRMIGSDPNSVIGLPLIRLVQMLEAEAIYLI